MEGDFKYELFQVLLDFDYDCYVEMLGLCGLWLDDLDQVVVVFEDVFNVDCLVVINVVVDLNVLLLFIYFELDQVKGYMSLILKGDLEVGLQICQLVKVMVVKYLKC